MVSAGRDKTVKLWNVNTRECVSILRGHSSNVEFLLFIKSSENTLNIPLLVSADDWIINLWSVNTSECLFTFGKGIRYGLYMTCLIFIPSNETSYNVPLIVSGDCDETVKLWNLNTGEFLSRFTGHKKTVKKIIFIPSSCNTLNIPIIASYSEDYTVKLWSLKDGTCLSTFKEEHGYLTDIIFITPGENTFNIPLIAIASSDKTIKLLNVNTGEWIFTIRGHKATIGSLLLIPPCENSFNLPIIVSRDDKTIHMNFFDQENPDINFKLNKEVDVNRPLLPDRENNSYRFVSENNTFNTFDFNSMRITKTPSVDIKIDYILPMLIYQNKVTLFGSSFNKSAIVYDNKDLKLLKSFNTNSEKKITGAHSLITKDKLTFLMGFEDGSVICFDYETEVVIFKHKEHLHPVTCLAGFTFGSKHFFMSGDKDGVVKVFNIKGGLSYELAVEDEILKFLSEVDINGKHYLIGFYENSLRVWVMAYARSIMKKRKLTNYFLSEPII